MEMLNVDRAAAYLRTADDCLIYIHTNPDGDAVGSGGALALALRRLGKRARVFCADEIPERLRFLTEAAADVPFTRTQDASATPLSVDVASAGQLGVSEAPHFALSIDRALDAVRVDVGPVFGRQLFRLLEEIFVDMFDRSTSCCCTRRCSARSC